MVLMGPEVKRASSEIPSWPMGVSAALLRFLLNCYVVGEKERVQKSIVLV
jgi:hypothetical protein